MTGAQTTKINAPESDQGRDQISTHSREINCPDKEVAVIVVTGSYVPGTLADGVDK